jgi:diguanylate cyclase (GGDEF)-like protein/PAS domain S-box-containing protein
MSAHSSLEPGALDERIGGLIETLVRTSQQIEQLTRGEVDSVADPSGRTFLLPAAQAQLRSAEAARQAGILDGLPAHVALLDVTGVIVSVNRAWRRYGAANGGRGPRDTLGVNYLDVCERARGAGAAGAEEVATGIRSVLSGEAGHYSHQYPCHAPHEQRWFMMSVTPLYEDRLGGAVVMHVDVSAEHRLNDSLRTSEQRFREMAENIRDVFFLRDARGDRMLYVSPAYDQIWGRDRQSLYTSLDSWSEGIHPDDRAAAGVLLGEGKLAQAFEIEYRVVQPTGDIRWVQSRGYPVLDRHGGIERIAGVVRDITEHKESERRIAHLHRVSSVLSAINMLIVRVRVRDELFREACRIAVEVGAFRMCWIGILDAERTRIVPIASQGVDKEMLELVRERFSLLPDAPLGNTMVARAVRERRTIVKNDLAENPNALLVAHHVAAGIQSMVVLPLLVGGQAAGIVAIYAVEKHFFHTGELNLLEELTGDIAFAMDHIDKQERLDYLAFYDVLTGLANRRLFLERTAQFVRDASGSEGRLAIFVIDLAGFRNINEGLGWAAGDALLCSVVAWMTEAVGDLNLLARIGADLFAVVMPRVRAAADIVGLVEQTLENFSSHSFALEGSALRVAARVGIAIYPDDGDSAEATLMHAEVALQRAKSGGERYMFYTRKMTTATSVRLGLETQLRQALERNEFVLHYQPKLDLASGQLTGSEALLRWNDPNGGLIQPARFIPVLEETGLIREVGRWVMRQAIGDYLAWRETGLQAVRIAVNVSPLQLRERNFVDLVGAAIAIHPDGPEALEIEITESVVMAEVARSIESLRAIRAMGVTIAIDDFGTGFSSLSYLARLPIDALKIDRSFIVDMSLAPEGPPLVATIINLAHSLRLKVVAEGVETQEQLRLLRLLNCDEVQGFLFSRPLPAEVFAATYLADPAAATGVHHADVIAPWLLKGSA